MHRCLLIPEIVCLVCLELRNEHPDASLAAFAQTCLVFSEPALNALWYELYDLQPLVKCMPRDLWEVEYIGQSQTEKLVLYSLPFPVL
jgi:hypothetical protein